MGAGPGRVARCRTERPGSVALRRAGVGPAVTHGLRRVIPPTLATVAALFALTLLAVAPAHAADPEFGTPTIDATFGEGVEVTQPVTLDETPARVEVLLTFAD